MHTFCQQKKTFILSKHYALRSFFLIFLWKTPCCHAHMWSKNVNYVKTTIYVPEKSIECLFFRFVTKNHLLSCPYCDKNVNSLKHTLLSCPYFVKKRQLSQKYKCSHVILFKFFIQNPRFGCPYLFKNFNSVKTTLYYGWEKKSTFGGVGGRSWAFVAAIGIKITIYYRNGRFVFTKYGHQNIVL